MAEPEEEPFAEEDAEETEAPSAVDPSSARRIRNRTVRERAEAKAVWDAMLASPAGRRELWGILEAAGTFRKRFGAGPNGFPQPEATQYYDAQRSMGWDMLLGWLAISPDGVIEMLKEHHPSLRPEPKPRRKRQARTQAEAWAQEDEIG